MVGKKTNYLAVVANPKIDLITQMEVICKQETLLLNDLCVQKYLVEKCFWEDNNYCKYVAACSTVAVMS